MAKQLRPADWQLVQAVWEEDPKASYAQAAKTAAKRGKFKEPAKQSVHRRAKRDGWEKKATAEQINEEAYRVADSRTNDDGSDDDLPDTKRAAGKEESVSKRAGVITRHRKELEELEQFRRHSLLKLKAAIEAKTETAPEVVPGDREEELAELNKAEKHLWWVAKIASDTMQHHILGLMRKQDSERKAWGLEQMSQPDPEPPRGRFKFTTSLLGKDEG